MTSHQMDYKQISGEYYDYEVNMLPEQEYLHDYTKTMTMKLVLSIPTTEGGTKVFLTFEQALELIKMTDQLTRGIKKIIYLVGWQFNGHDDKYPSFEEVNPALKRKEDTEAKQSLIWLMEQAYQYHTTVSLHINMTDAYEDSPLWETYIGNNLIAKNEKGELLAIGTWGANKTAYQVWYKNEWESGYAMRRIDRLVEMLPLQKAGTIHIDAYICRQFADSTMAEEREYRRKVIRYFRSLGIDVTSEFLYNCPGRDGGELPKEIAESEKDDLIGLVPMIWWLNQTKQDYIDRPRSLICGGRYNKDLDARRKDEIAFLVGNGVHGEEQFKQYAEGDEKWFEKFMETFCLDGIPWYYQNRFELEAILGDGNEQVAFYNDELKVILEGRRILHHGRALREGENLLMPILWKENELVAYSQSGYVDKVWQLPTFYEHFNRAEVFEITPEGLHQVKDIWIENQTITLSLRPHQALSVILRCE